MFDRHLLLVPTWFYERLTNTFRLINFGFFTCILILIKPFPPFKQKIILQNDYIYRFTFLKIIEKFYLKHKLEKIRHLVL